MATAFPAWQELEDLLAEISRRGIEQMAAEDILTFGRWYRRAAAELSFHRTHQVDQQYLAYLNDLLGRCYPFVYTAPRRPWPSVLRFFAVDFPQAVRRHAMWIFLATLLALLPGAVGFTLAWHDRALAEQVLPGDLMESSDRVAQRHHTANNWLPLLERTPSASAILTNNITVSITAFAGGMTAGLVTILLMIYNGLMLGIVAAAVGHDGPATAVNFWAFVAPHGIIELTAIFMSGGAGLMLAYALLNPGELPRRIALREAGREAGKIMLGVMAMLTVAGFVEGLFSPTVGIPEAVKFLVAAIEGTLLFCYFTFAGRKANTETEGPKLMTPMPPM